MDGLLDWDHDDRKKEMIEQLEWMSEFEIECHRHLFVTHPFLCEVVFSFRGVPSVEGVAVHHRLPGKDCCSHQSRLKSVETSMEKKMPWTMSRMDSWLPWLREETSLETS